MLILSDKFIHKTVFLPSKPNVALISIAFRDNKTVDLDVYKRQIFSFRIS